MVKYLHGFLELPYPQVIPENIHPQMILLGAAKCNVLHSLSKEMGARNSPLLKHTPILTPFLEIQIFKKYVGLAFISPTSLEA